MRPTPSRQTLAQSAPEIPPNLAPGDSSTLANPSRRQAPERPDVSHFDKLPDVALVAIRAVAAVAGGGVSTAWRNLRTDPDFPKAIHLSPGCTRFRVGDIRAYLAKKASAPVNPKRAQRMKGWVAQ